MDHLGKVPIDYALTPDMQKLLQKEVKDEYKTEKDKIFKSEVFASPEKNISLTGCLQLNETKKSFCTTKGFGKLESFDEYLKKMKEGELCTTNKNYEFYDDDINKPNNENAKEFVLELPKNLKTRQKKEDLVRIETQLTKTSKNLDTLREEESKFEATDKLHKILEDVSPEQKFCKIKTEEKAYWANKENDIPKFEDSIITRKNSMVIHQEKSINIKLNSPVLQAQRLNGITERIVNDSNPNYTKTSYEITQDFFRERIPSEQITSICDTQVAVFRSQKNDITNYLKKQRKINKINKEETKIVTDIYNDLLTQMENYTKQEQNEETVNLETVNENYQHFESVLNHAQTIEKNELAKDLIDLDKELLKNSARQHKTNPSESGNRLYKREKYTSQRVSTEEIPPSQPLNILNQDPVTFRNPNQDIITRLSEDLEMWLEEIKLKHLGQALARSGISTQKILMDQLMGQDYCKAINYLKSKGVDKKGNCIRIILAMDNENGKLRIHVENLFLKGKKSDNKRTSAISLSSIGLECCGKPPHAFPDFMNPPCLKQWLKNQNLEQYYNRFVIAGYDDYEWLLIQMNSEHPLTDTILSQEICITQASIRNRIIYKLQDGTLYYYN